MPSIRNLYSFGRSLFYLALAPLLFSAAPSSKNCPTCIDFAVESYEKIEDCAIFNRDKSMKNLEESGVERLVACGEESRNIDKLLENYQFYKSWRFIIHLNAGQDPYASEITVEASQLEIIK